jgi:SWIM zinc finger
MLILIKYFASKPIFFLDHAYRQDQLSHRRAREAFCKGRPKNVVAALQLRSSRADVMGCALTELPERPGSFLVFKSDDTLRQMHHDDSLDAVQADISFEQYKSNLPASQSCYHVNINAGQCSCPDNRLLRMPCKHMFMVFKHSTAYSFANLPQSLLQSQYMVIDADVVQVGHD